MSSIHPSTENATPLKMDAELKAKWVSALRGGTYKQARETLHIDGGFCCLGVLLDISGVGQWDGCSYEYGTDEGHVRSADGDLCSLRKRFRIEGKQESLLVAMNDGLDEFKGTPKSFPEIADWIEANL